MSGHDAVPLLFVVTVAFFPASGPLLTENVTAAPDTGPPLESTTETLIEIFVPSGYVAVLGDSVSLMPEAVVLHGNPDGFQGWASDRLKTWAS